MGVAITTQEMVTLREHIYRKNFHLEENWGQLFGDMLEDSKWTEDDLFNFYPDQDEWEYRWLLQKLSRYSQVVPVFAQVKELFEKLFEKVYENKEARPLFLTSVRSDVAFFDRELRKFFEMVAMILTIDIKRPATTKPTPGVES